MHNHAPATKDAWDHQMHRLTMPGSESGQAPPDPHQQPPKTNCYVPPSNNAVGPSLLRHHTADTAAADAACPQVQFGVFTNLASGGTFMGPSKASEASHEAMSRYASDDLAASAIQKRGDAPGEPEQQGTSLAIGTGFAHPHAVGAIRRLQGTVNEQALKKHGHTHQQPLSGQQDKSPGQPSGLMTAADPATATAAAALNSHTDTGTAGSACMHAAAADSIGLSATDTAGPAVMHAAAPAAGPTVAKMCGSSDAVGGCLPVQFGVFTNLKSGSLYATSEKLSEHAKQRARKIFPVGALDLPAAVAPAAGKAQPAQQQPNGLQPATAARGIDHTTDHLCLGMLCPSSCQNCKLMFWQGCHRVVKLMFPH